MSVRRAHAPRDAKMPSRAMKTKQQSSGGAKGRGVAHALLRRTKSSSGDVVANALTVSPFTTSLTSLEASLANVGLVVALAPERGGAGAAVQAIAAWLARSVAVSWTNSMIA